MKYKYKYKVTIYFLSETYDKNLNVIRRWFRYAKYYFIRKKSALHCVKLYSMTKREKATIQLINYGKKN